MVISAQEIDNASANVIVGGDETLAVDVVSGADGKNRLCISEQPLTSAVFATIPVGIVAIEAKVGAARLEGRRTLSFMPIDGVIYYGFDNTVTALSGRKVFKNQQIDLPLGDTAIWVIAAKDVGLSIWEAK